ncbi:glycyl-tRNA synthetase beta chain [Granulicatella balaenopterae]|uniref:Glycine--tRNA ligase beta subunit n=1 Tax=Granulicatella balaenopterae TaxID=137733 RepID=A0A1H9GRH9_9LACT|nr:glycine--tRNA ligase subunit beta [Granulicatella balaenopterae]SEQ52653.1 glycyl-tRNA synthetase beta chain [Granulicatella balaenopterae]
MTESLLLEIGLEELPAKYVRSSAKQLGERVAKFLDDAKLGHGEVEVFATPRRLAVRVQDIQDKQEDKVEVFKGPSLAIAKKDGEWTKAAEGFVRGKGLTVDDIYVEEVSGVEYIHVKKEFIGQEAKAVLANLASVITDMKFPVTMRWSNHSFEYLRPIHWIIALFGGEVLSDVKVLNVVADRKTKGHRFLGQEVDITSPETYEAELKEQFVIVNQDERKAMVREQIEAMAAKNNWVIPIDEDLLEEVSSILEYPTVFVGDFDEKYLEVPTPVLVTSMKEHQRYFVVFNQEGELLPHFISARNGDSHAIENVIKGNQKVLTARLEDGLFFYQEDQKVPMADSIQKLQTLNFHAKIGSMTEKMDRVKALVEQLADTLALGEDVKRTAMRAAEVYKFDLVTNMVGEFPELQGIMGEIYALEQGETKEVAAAIREHYMPTSADGELPQTTAGALLAVADKIDSFLSFMSVGLVPTGSNDPYALRRQVMGVVQIMDNNNWNISLSELFNELLVANYSAFMTKPEAEVMTSVDTFLRDRISQKLQSVTKRHDVIEAVLGSGNRVVAQLMALATVLDEKHDNKDFKATVEGLNRVVNISMKDATREDLTASLTATIDESLFQTDSEKALFAAINNLNITDNNKTLTEKYQELEAMVPSITNFFNENMVMVDDKAIKSNRITMLRRLAVFITSIADFNLLVVK